jgi:hypothetical protein
MGGNRNRRGLAATAAGQGQLGPTSSRDSMKGKTMVYDRYLSPKQRKFLFPSLQTAFLDSVDICSVMCVFEGVKMVFHVVQVVAISLPSMYWQGRLIYVAPSEHLVW